MRAYISPVGGTVPWTTDYNNFLYGWLYCQRYQVCLISGRSVKKFLFSRYLKLECFRKKAKALELF